jgi:phytoene dehydrogenase-like protein
VVSNVDLRETCEGLLQNGELPQAYRDRVGRMKPSVSAFTVFGMTDLDVTRYLRAYETVCYDSLDHDRSHQRIEAGDIAVLFITVPTMADPSNAPAGKHLLTLTALAEGGGSEEAWRSQKSAFSERMIARAETVLPGLRDHFEVLAAASPATYRGYTGNQNGAMVR